MRKLLIVEDDDLCAKSLCHLLDKRTKSQAWEVSIAYSSQEARKLIDKEKYDICFLDLDLEYPQAGIELISPLKAKGAIVTVLSGHRRNDIVEKSYLSGADDYLVKPVRADELDSLFSRLQKEQKNKSIRDHVVGHNDEFICELKRLDDVAPTDLPVLFEGETGTGKTFLANIVHRFSRRAAGPFVQLNCSEMSESLVESELFGHVKGAFSGALTDKRGKLEMANGGTLFLDELGATSKNIQLKLLKAIEEKSFYPVGGEKLIRSDFRIISATCDNLGELVREGEFREDLYFRLYGHSIRLLPLRQRREDIDDLIESFLAQSSRKIFLTPEAREKLCSYDWPGNIRELEKSVTQLLSLSRGFIEAKDLPSHILNNTHPLGTVGKVSVSDVLSSQQLEKVKERGLKSLISEVENEVVSYFLERNEGKVRQTMGELGISNSAFYRILDRINARANI